MTNFLQKIFYQPRRSFPTTDPIAYQLKQSLMAKLTGLKPLSSLMYVTPSWRKKATRLDINERIVEMPFVFHNLPKTSKNKKVLDVGCCETILPIQLASLGYKTTGIDIRPYELNHPNFSFVQDDICFAQMPNQQFDLITCVSVIEHIGLDTIYGKSRHKSSDEKAINSIFGLLKPGGRLILTTPVAKQFSQSSFMRIYTPAKIHQLLKKFLIIKEEYFAPNDQRVDWQKCSASKLPTKLNFGVTAIVAQKPDQPRK